MAFNQHDRVFYSFFCGCQYSNWHLRGVLAYLIDDGSNHINFFIDGVLAISEQNPDGGVIVGTDRLAAVSLPPPPCTNHTLIRVTHIHVCKIYTWERDLAQLRVEHNKSSHHKHARERICTNAHVGNMSTDNIARTRSLYHEYMHRMGIWARWWLVQIRLAGKLFPISRCIPVLVLLFYYCLIFNSYKVRMAFLEDAQFHRIHKIFPHNSHSLFKKFPL